jgi:long-chain acyl-CoA synthetase
MLSDLKKWFGFGLSEQERFDEYYKSILVDGKMIFAGSLLQRSAKKYPLHTALICRDDSITYQDLYNKTIPISKKLISMGVVPGDRVILIMENSIEFYLGYYGIWQTGAVVAPLNTFLHVREMNHIIENAQPKAMIISNTFAQRLQEFNDIKLPPYLTEDDLHDLAQDAKSDATFSIPAVPADRMAAILYTSGTTGFPKGVMLSSKNILTNIVQGICRTDIVPTDSLLGALPFFHSFAQFACVWGSFFLGGTTIVIPRIERRLLLEGLEHQPSLIAGVPALYGLFCLMRNVPFPRVRYFISGGDAMPDKIRVAFEMIYRRRICNGYGLTETSPLIAVNLKDELLAPNTVGKVCLGIQCSLRDEVGNEVKNGQKGILWVKGDNVMLGYYDAPELTEKVLKDGWLDTGDWAYFDSQNRLVISGRHKDLIIHKGINVYPPEIENVLMGHSAVINAAVVGKKDPDVGEFPVAFVVLKEVLENAEDVLKKLCQQHLAAYKVPKQIWVLKQEELPLTPLKKIDKKRLRKEFLGQENH